MTKSGSRNFNEQQIKQFSNHFSAKYGENWLDRSYRNDPESYAILKIKVNATNRTKIFNLVTWLKRQPDTDGIKHVNVATEVTFDQYADKSGSSNQNLIKDDCQHLTDPNTPADTGVSDTLSQKEVAINIDIMHEVDLGKAENTHPNLGEGNLQDSTDMKYTSAEMEDNDI